MIYVLCCVRFAALTSSELSDLRSAYVNFRELLSTQIIGGEESRIKGVPSGLCFCVASH
jgi:hypothetical protein